MFRRFFSDRYGFDNLGFAVTVAALIVGIVSTFFNGIAGWVLRIVQSLLLIYVFVRALSRNHGARRRENAKYLRASASVRKFFRPISECLARHFGDRAHKYFKCPGCRAVLRVPRGHGKITVTCPKCGRRFDKRS